MRENLPERFCAIFAMVTLPNRHLAVYRLTGPRLYEIDIFDAQGQYVYQLKFPENLKYVTESFYGNQDRLTLVAAVDDRDICREYRIKNLP
ncbi:MAG: hypothetical protein GY950_21710, partial [bacterium]|nr:hypothetical protein [bacterium]